MITRNTIIIIIGAMMYIWNREELSIEIIKGVRVEEEEIRYLGGGGLILGIIAEITKFTDYKIRESKLLITGIMIGGVLLLHKEIFITIMSLTIINIATYILLLGKSSRVTNKVVIYYFFTGVFIFSFLTLTLLISYSQTGFWTPDFSSASTSTLSLFTNSFLDTLSTHSNGVCGEGVKVWVIGVIVTIMFKLGIFPFISPIVRVYTGLEDKIYIFIITFYKYIFTIFMIVIIERYFLIFLTTPGILLGIIIPVTITIYYGTLGGLLQSNIKSIMIYSSLVQSGVFLLGVILVLTTKGLESSHMAKIFLDSFPFYYGWGIELGHLIFFIFTYILTISGVFLIIYLFTYNDLSPFSFYIPFEKFKLQLLSLFLFVASLIGIPPFPGFFSKFFLFFFNLSENSTFSLLSSFFLFFSSFFTSLLYLKLLLSPLSSPALSNQTQSFSFLKESSKFFNLLLSLFLSSFLFFPLLSPFIFPLFF